MNDIKKVVYPNCGTEMISEGVDIGIGYIYPPYHCRNCGYNGANTTWDDQMLAILKSIGTIASFTLTSQMYDDVFGDFLLEKDTSIVRSYGNNPDDGKPYDQTTTYASNALDLWYSNDVPFENDAATSNVVILGNGHPDLKTYEAVMDYIEKLKIFVHNVIIFRPHRGTLEDSMSQAKEFADESQMFDHIVKIWHGAILKEDLAINPEATNDPRIGWKDSKYVCTKKICGKEYDTPQCIGMCATDY